jgi:hypothetical protein
MPPVDKPTSFEQKVPLSEGRRSKAASSAADEPVSADLVAFTIDAASARIVSIEHVDDTGVRREFSEDDRTRLAKMEGGATLEGLVEKVFEAGIDCVLGAEAEAAESDESADDDQLSGLLLRSLISHSPAQRFLQGEVLNRAVIGTLIRQAAERRPAPASGGVAH